MTSVNQRVATLLQDTQVEHDEKIRILRQLEADALSKERSATEGFTPVDGDDGEDLKAIEKALMSLGENKTERGAATL